jgi:hypothetical protein
MADMSQRNANETRDESDEALETGIESPTDAATDLIGIFKDGVIGAVAGAAGTVMLSAVLFVALNLGMFDSSAFNGLAVMIGLGGNTFIGYLIFFAGGMTTWPLLFVSLQEYLPGSTLALRGVTFATVTWTGFLGAFYTGQSGLALAGYVVFSLVAHWAYGFTLGSVFAYFLERVDTRIGGRRQIT